MKKLIKKNNKSVSKFQLGGLFFTESAHPERTWVNAIEARKRGIPLTADPRDPNAQWTYSYEILDPTQGTRSNTIDENPVVNPESVYFLYDPNTGKILNQGMGITDNALGLIPVDNSWAYHPLMGWFLPNLNNGTVEDADAAALLNSFKDLNELFGLALGALVPLNANPELLEGSMSRTKPLVLGAASVLLGGAAGQGALAIAQSAKGIPLWLGRTATAGLLGAEAAPAYADWAEAKQVTEMASELSKINNFTGADFERLKAKYGDKVLPMLLGWIEAQEYAISSNNGKAAANSTFTVKTNKKPEVFSWTNPDALFYAKNPRHLLIPSAIATMAWPSKGNIGGRGVRALLGLALLAAYGYLEYDLWLKTFGTSENVKKAQQIVETLNSLGYNFYGDLGNKLQPYTVETNSQGQPQINNAQNSDITVRDSAATPVADEVPAVTETERSDWNGKLGSTIDSLRQQ